MLVDVQVVGRDDELRFDALEVSAGIGHDAVGFFFAMPAGGCDDVEPRFVRGQDADDRMVFRAGSFRFKVGSVLPDMDIAQGLGSSTNRWSAVYALNGTIQT